MNQSSSQFKGEFHDNYNIFGVKQTQKCELEASTPPNRNKFFVDGSSAKDSAPQDHTQQVQYGDQKMLNSWYEINQQHMIVKDQKQLKSQTSQQSLQEKTQAKQNELPPSTDPRNHLAYKHTKSSQQKTISNHELQSQTLHSSQQTLTQFQNFMNKKQSTPIERSEIDQYLGLRSSIHGQKRSSHASLSKESPFGLNSEIRYKTKLGIQKMEFAQHYEKDQIVMKNTRGNKESDIFEDFENLTQRFQSNQASKYKYIDLNESSEDASPDPNHQHMQSSPSFNKPQNLPYHSDHQLLNQAIFQTSLGQNLDERTQCYEENEDQHITISSGNGAQDNEEAEQEENLESNPIVEDEQLNRVMPDLEGPDTARDPLAPQNPHQSISNSLTLLFNHSKHKQQAHFKQQQMQEQQQLNQQVHQYLQSDSLLPSLQSAGFNHNQHMHQLQTRSVRRDRASRSGSSTLNHQLVQASGQMMNAASAQRQADKGGDFDEGYQTQRNVSEVLHDSTPCQTREGVVENGVGDGTNEKVMLLHVEEDGIVGDSKEYVDAMQVDEDEDEDVDGGREIFEEVNEEDDKRRRKYGYMQTEYEILREQESSCEDNYDNIADNQNKEEICVTALLANKGHKKNISHLIKSATPENVSDDDQLECNKIQSDTKKKESRKRADRGGYAPVSLFSTVKKLNKKSSSKKQTPKCPDKSSKKKITSDNSNSKKKSMQDAQISDLSKRVFSPTAQTKSRGIINFDKSVTHQSSFTPRQHPSTTHQSKQNQPKQTKLKDYQSKVKHNKTAFGTTMKPKEDKSFTHFPSQLANNIEHKDDKLKKPQAANTVAKIQESSYLNDLHKPKISSQHMPKLEQSRNPIDTSHSTQQLRQYYAQQQMQSHSQSSMLLSTVSSQQQKQLPYGISTIPAVIDKKKSSNHHTSRQTSTTNLFSKQADMVANSQQTTSSLNNRRKPAQSLLTANCVAGGPNHLTQQNEPKKSQTSGVSANSMSVLAAGGSGQSLFNHIRKKQTDSFHTKIIGDKVVGHPSTHLGHAIINGDTSILNEKSVKVGNISGIIPVRKQASGKSQKSQISTQHKKQGSLLEKMKQPQKPSATPAFKHQQAYITPHYLAHKRHSQDMEKLHSQSALLMSVPPYATQGNEDDEEHEEHQSIAEEDYFIIDEDDPQNRNSSGNSTVNEIQQTKSIINSSQSHLPLPTIQANQDIKLGMDLHPYQRLAQAKGQKSANSHSSNQQAKLSSTSQIFKKRKEESKNNLIASVAQKQKGQTAKVNASVSGVNGRSQSAIRKQSGQLGHHQKYPKPNINPLGIQPLLAQNADHHPPSSSQYTSTCTATDSTVFRKRQSEQVDRTSSNQIPQHFEGDHQSSSSFRGAGSKQNINSNNPYRQAVPVEYAATSSYPSAGLQIQQPQLQPASLQAGKHEVRQKDNNKQSATEMRKVSSQTIGHNQRQDWGLLDVEKATYGDRCPKGYEKVKLLGKGGCAIVWLARKISTGKVVALKQFPKPKGNVSAILDSSARNEIEICKMLFVQDTDGDESYTIDPKQFPGIKRITKLYEVIEESRDIWLSYEVGGESLGNHLFTMKGQYHNGERVYNIQHQELYKAIKADKKILADLIFMMAQVQDVLAIFRIIHADIKPDNILIDFDGSKINDIKVIDFGSAFSFENAQNISATTPEYLAPEILDYLEKRTQNTVVGGSCGTNLQKIQEPWSYDMWSMGTILLEILTGIPVWIAYKCRAQTHTGKQCLNVGIFGSQGRQGKKILQKQQSSLKNLSQTLKKYDCYGLDKDVYFMDLLTKMLDPNPMTRISPIEVQQHPFVANCCAAIKAKKTTTLGAKVVLSKN